jgi:hypothetical protein
VNPLSVTSVTPSSTTTSYQNDYSRGSPTKSPGGGRALYSKLTQERDLPEYDITPVSPAPNVKSSPRVNASPAPYATSPAPYATSPSSYPSNVSQYAGSPAPRSSQLDLSSRLEQMRVSSSPITPKYEAPPPRSPIGISSPKDSQFVSLDEHSVGVTEVVVHTTDPQAPKIVYEIHDVDLESNEAINLRLKERLEEAERRAKQEDREFAQRTIADAQNHLEHQKQHDRARKQDQENQLRRWKDNWTEEQARRHEQNESDKEQTRKQLQTVQEQIQEFEKMNQEYEERRKRRYIDELNQTKEYRDNLKAQQAWEEQQMPQGSSLKFIPTKEGVTGEEYRKLQQRTAQTLAKQVREKELENHYLREKDIHDYRDACNRNLQDERERNARYAQEREELREQLKRDWQGFQSEKIARKSEAERANQEELEIRKQFEENLNHNRRNEILRRTELIKQRKNDLENQMRYVAELKDEELYQKRVEDQQLFNKLNNREVRKKMYRCKKTRKVLPPDQFNVYVPKTHREAKLATTERF